MVKALGFDTTNPRSSPTVIGVTHLVASIRVSGQNCASATEKSHPTRRNVRQPSQRPLSFIEYSAGALLCPQRAFLQADERPIFNEL